MSYQVKPGEGEITVHSGASQKIQFTVNNTSNRPMLTQTELRVGGAVDLQWCSVDPATDTNLEAKGSRTYTVTVAPTGVSRPTSGHVQLAAASVDDPSHATPSPEVRVTILTAESTPTWWQRHGKKVLIGAGAVLLAAVIVGIIMSRPSGVAIEAFRSSPASGAPVGEPVSLTWEIEGKPEGVLLAVGEGEGTPLDEGQWKAGSFQFTAVTPGPLTVRLTAIEAGTDDEAPLEISRKLDLTITESERTFTTPAITSFAVASPSVPAGQPVRFAWTTTGDVLALSIDFGNDAPPTVTDPERIAAGSLELPLLPGTYRAVATATGMDNARVESEAVAFVVTDQASQQAPKVTLSAAATGRATLEFAGRKLPDLAVSWNVDGEHTGLQLSFLTHGATPSVHALSTANGQQTFKRVYVPEGSVVQLFVGQRTGPRLVYECQVGRPRIKEGPVKFEVPELQFELRDRVLDDSRVIRTMKPGALLHREGG